MAIEIERKFLVRDAAWRAAAHERVRMTQGYLANTARSSVRVRRAGDRAWLSVKSMTTDLVRLEYEYPVPADEAASMLERLCEGPLVDKVRHYVRVGAHEWEIDEFLGDNAGLVVAELELEAPDESFERPAWLGAEVTHAARYYNFNLATRPYRVWSGDERGAD